MRSRLLLLVALLYGLSCTITQEVDPIDRTGIEKVCIIEDPTVREGFLLEYRKALDQLGIANEVLPAGSATDACEITSTYLAKWSWDLTIYMSYAVIKVFRGGDPVGEAVYDARKGSGNLNKFIDAEPKIHELVQKLFGGTPASAAR